MAEARILNNRYRLLEEVGRGGMAVVYKGYDTLLGRVVAVKVLHPYYSGDEAFLERLRREAQAAASLSHPNIVGVYDIGQDGDSHYLVMEYIEGRSLKELIAEEAPFSLQRALGLAIQICAGLGHAHRRGLVHRDVKPGNILVTDDDHVKVTDFGIARALGAASMTEEGVVWGTPQYLSPEQARGEPATLASDVYSLGVVLYQMLSGRLPFQAESHLGVALKHLQEQATPLHQLNPHVPPHIEAIVARALAKAPEARFPTGDALGEALREYHATSVEVTAPAAALPREIRARSAATTPSAPSFDWLGLALGLVTLVAMLGLVPLWTTVSARYTPTPTPAPTAIPQVRVPYLIGLEQDEARRQIEELGLKFELIGTRPDDTVPALQVLEQTVNGDSVVDIGSSVGVVLSSGPEFAPVPSVVGENGDVAAQRLAEAGFAVSREEVWDGDTVAGTVLRQEPGGDEPAPRGSTIHLVVSTGQRIPLGVNLGRKVFLLAADLDRDELRPGDILHLALYWQSLQPMETSYTVFVHVAGDDGSILTQRDSPPLDGRRPTNTWIVGEQIEDPYELRIPADAPVGTYWVKVGLYLPTTLQRLPVVDAGRARSTTDSVLLKQVSVVR